MGQTWSVPAISAVATTDNKTTRNPSGVEFVAYVGSGYSPVASEGSTLFALDAITGDVVGYYDVGDRGSAGSFGGATFENAIVASPAVLLPSTYSFESFVHPSDAYAARVYVGDLHGRIWAFPPKGGSAFAPLLGSYFADLGADQPIASGVALLYYDSDATKKSAHVYVETGNDKRVAKPGDTPPFGKTPPFYMVGMRDEEATSTATPSSNTLVNGPAKELFAKPLPNDVPTGAPGYRGTVQPTVTFNSQRLGRVFFAGNQFTPAGTSCLSRLDAILFALSARDGVAAFDLNAEGQDEYYIIPNQVVLQLDLVRVPPESGRLNISQAIPCDPSTDPAKCTDPPATVKPPKNTSIAPAVRSDVYPLEMKFASAVCRQ